MKHEMIPLGLNVPQIAQAFADSGRFEDAQGYAQHVKERSE